MRWELGTIVQAQCSRGDRLLALTIQGGGWHWLVTVVETGAKKLSKRNLSPELVVRAVFEDHAHEVLAAQRSLPEAIALAHRYAEWWQGSRASHFLCVCDDVAAAP